jgi:hypothetical protein
MGFRNFSCLGRRRRQTALVAGVGIVLSSLLAAVPAGATGTSLGTRHSASPAPSAPPAATNPLNSSGAARLGPWQPVGSYSEPSYTADQGLATLTIGHKSSTIVYRGDASIPPQLYWQGWQHIGDPGAGGSPRSYLFDAYQGSPSATSKLYEATTPAGAHYDFVHPLAPGEQYNNSFAAVSPDGKWMVSGEWGDMTRLLVFPAPLLNLSPTGQLTTLNLAGTVQLAHTVRNIQGCDFVTSTQLLCSSDDPNTDLFPTPKQLLQVDLSAPLNGSGSDNATVTSLGELPLQSTCAGNFEVEGIDYYTPTKQMRVGVIPPSPCDVTTTVYVYRHA